MAKSALTPRPRVSTGARPFSPRNPDGTFRANVTASQQGKANLSPVARLVSVRDAARRRGDYLAAAVAERRLAEVGAEYHAKVSYSGPRRTNYSGFEVS